MCFDSLCTLLSNCSDTPTTQFRVLAPTIVVIASPSINTQNWLHNRGIRTVTLQSCTHVIFLALLHVPFSRQRPQLWQRTARLERDRRQLEGTACARTVVVGHVGGTRSLVCFSSNGARCGAVPPGATSAVNGDLATRVDSAPLNRVNELFSCQRRQVGLRATSQVGSVGLHCTVLHYIVEASMGLFDVVITL